MQVALIPLAAAKQTGKPQGFYVTAVAPGGPAEAAGLRAGDVITAIDGEPATDPNQLAAATLKKKPGETVKLTYVREGQTADAVVTLGAQP